MLLFSVLPVCAADLTEAEVEQAVAEQGKETVTGNVFVWFLCAIIFFKSVRKLTLSCLPWESTLEIPEEI